MTICTEFTVNIALTLTTTARCALLGLPSPDQVRLFFTARPNVDGV